MNQIVRFANQAKRMAGTYRAALVLQLLNDGEIALDADLEHAKTPQGVCPNGVHVTLLIFHIMKLNPIL
ncbi:hypothetical protein [Paenibacillus glucanolyticus]|uniref:hypothetical protein n=1 Tax=Paenibacillus glucanolyticus TaxID=59843 RepID=UPI0034CF9AAB